MWGEAGKGTGLGSDPTDIMGIVLAGEKGANSSDLSKKKDKALAMVDVISVTNSPLYTAFNTCSLYDCCLNLLII